MKRLTALILVLGLVLSVPILAAGDWIKSGSSAANGGTSYTLPQGSTWCEVHVWGDGSANFTATVYRRATIDSPDIVVGTVASPDVVGKNWGGPAGEVISVVITSYAAGTCYWRVVAR